MEKYTEIPTTDTTEKISKCGRKPNMIHMMLVVVGFPGMNDNIFDVVRNDRLAKTSGAYSFIKCV